MKLYDYYRRFARHWLTSVVIAVYFVYLAWHFESWVLGVTAGIMLCAAVTDSTDAYFERWKRNYLKKHGDNNA